MKKILLLKLIFVTISSLSFCQEYDVKIGPINDFEKNYYLEGNAGKNDITSYFMYRRINYGSRNVYDYFLNGYDIKSMALKFSNEIVIPNSEMTKNKEFYTMKYLFLKNKYYLFGFEFNRKEDTKTAVLFNVDPANGKLSDNYLEVDRLENISLRENASFDYSISDDSSKIIFFHQLDINQKAKEKYSVSLYDSDLRFLWKKDFVSEETDQDLELLNFQVDKDGNFYQLTKVKNVKNDNKYKPDWKYQIQAYWPSTNISKVIDIDLGGSYVNNMKMGVSKTGSLVCVGLYGDVDPNSKSMKNRFDKSNGLFFLTINNQDQKIAEIKKHEFSKNPTFSDVLINASQLEFLVIDDNIKFFDDGSMYVFGEQCIKSVGSSIQVSKFGYLALFSLKSNGDPSWTTKINKLQSTGTGIGSYFEFFKDKNVYFVYNDDIRNLGLKDEANRKILNAVGNSLTMISSINSEGKVNTKSLFPTQDTKYCFSFWQSRQINEGEALLYRKAESGSDFQFVTVTVK
jgi:hypothetical protein